MDAGCWSEEDQDAGNLIIEGGGGERRVRIQMSCRDAWLFELIKSTILG
jgi:hypothetical protein